MLSKVFTKFLMIELSLKESNYNIIDQARVMIKNLQSYFAFGMQQIKLTSINFSFNYMV